MTTDNGENGENGESFNFLPTHPPVSAEQVDPNYRETYAIAVEEGFSPERARELARMIYEGDLTALDILEWAADKPDVVGFTLEVQKFLSQLKTDPTGQFVFDADGLPVPLSFIVEQVTKQEFNQFTLERWATPTEQLVIDPVTGEETTHYQYPIPWYSYLKKKEYFEKAEPQLVEPLEETLPTPEQPYGKPPPWTGGQISEEEKRKRESERLIAKQLKEQQDAYKDLYHRAQKVTRI